ncbi:MAG TPA: phosphotransferase [Kofleriaceae bacterium]|nr:phosphotransferase [Kofleriaceae bacterium]
MSSPADLARSALAEHLARRRGEWAFGEVVLAGEGLECFVFRGTSPRLGDVAIKVPRCAVFENDNDLSVPAGALLRQEAEYAQHLREHGLAAPEVLALEVGDAAPAYLIQRYIEHDGGEPDPGELGRLIAAIHRLPLPPGRPVAQGAGAVEGVIAERLARRARVVERIAGVAVPLPDRRALEAALALAGRPHRLLHMDARAANVLTEGGTIRAIIDWSNALIGDPYLELARIAEYGLAGAAFRAAYDAPVAPPAPVLDCIYHLDVAVMLAVVFLSELPDPVRGPRQIERVLTLSRELERLWPGAPAAVRSERR